MAAFEKADYEGAARIRQDQLKLDRDLESARARWRAETGEVTSTVTEENIAEIVAGWSGIPIARMLETEAEKLTYMEDNLHRRVIGQHDAITAVSNAIRRNRAGLRKVERPIGVFLFLGPTGVGKTELAKALAEFLLDDESRIIRLDLSEYMQEHEVSKLIGAPPGYVGYEEGGQLTERVRRKPYSVILLDELEKAHPDFFNMLLQIFDEGHLTDAKGRRVSFRNTLIIGTSNIGSASISQERRSIGFGAQDGLEFREISSEVMKEVRKLFKPEFLNRIDDIIVFHRLEHDHLKQILDLMLARVAERVSEQGFQLTVSQEVKDLLLKEGYSPQYGARPLERTVQRRLEDKLARALINSELQPGEPISAVLRDGKVAFEKAAEPVA